MGHIFFGGDMVHFNSFGASFNTAFLTLMGDFGWYSDLSETLLDLASGLPYWVVSTWFWSYMIFTVLILMNMLLAIVMDNYAAVTEELMAMADAPSLGTQIVRYRARMATARAGGFTPLHEFSEALEAKKDHTYNLS